MADSSEREGSNDADPPDPSVTDAALIDELVARERKRAMLEAESSEAMLAYVDARRESGRRAPAGSIGPGHARTAGEVQASFAADELGLALRLATGTVQRRLARVRRVRSRLPGVWDLHRDGRIDGCTVTLIDDAACRLVFGDSLVRLDAEVSQVATDKTSAQLRAWLHRFVARIEPEQVTKRYRRAFGDRTVYVNADADGIGWLNLCHNQSDLAKAETRLETMARSMGADDPRTMDQRKADIAVDLLLGRVSTGTTASSEAPDGFTGAATDPTQSVIGVVVPIQTLVGASEVPGETLDRQHVVPSDVVRQRAAEPGTLFYRLLTDPEGHLLDVSEPGRFPSDKLGFAVRARDGFSRFPTSTVPARLCDLDHSVAHSRGPEGGATSAANLGPLHRRCHNAKTLGVISLRQSQPGVFEWTTATGHTYTTQAEPLPTASWSSDDVGPTGHDRRDACLDEPDTDGCGGPSPPEPEPD